MSRVDFGGYSSPMPDISLPDPHLSEQLPTQVLELADGVPFKKTDWVALGYTHYEVWCVGAAGGWGSGVFDDVSWPLSYSIESAPPDIWAAHLAALAYFDTRLTPAKDFYRDYYTQVISSVPLNLPYGYLTYAGPENGYTGGYAYGLTHYQAEEYYNPQHLLSVTTIHAPFYQQSASAFGGAGGGGGLHVVSGRLDDLPDLVDVVVGKAGANALPGQTQSSGLWVPPFPPYPQVDPNDPASQWAVRHPDAIPSFSPPVAGEDGGASSFGGDICQASGGKGGHPAVVWANGVPMVDGGGGEGGVGGRSAPGGGAAGGLPEQDVYSETLKRAGQDGTWDGTIGQGGGGGRGGTYRYVSPNSPISGGR
jgi:hypothetical protein